MTTFESSMEAHKIKHTKWQVLLTLQVTGKVLAYVALSSEDSKNFTKVKKPYLSIMILMKGHITRDSGQLRQRRESLLLR